MKIEEFRKHKYLPHTWRKELQTNGILQLVIEVLEDAHPTRYSVSTDLQDDLSPTKAALQLGHTRGYSAVLNTIRQLAVPLVTPGNMPQPTYQPSEAEEAQPQKI